MMGEESPMQKRAKSIIELALIENGDTVLILCDHHTAPVGELLARQVGQLDAMPIFTSIPSLKAHGDLVPAPVVRMAMDVDIIIAPMMTGIAHTSLRYEAVASLKFYSKIAYKKADFHCLSRAKQFSFTKNTFSSCRYTAFSI
jgi:hypothetical protein